MSETTSQIAVMSIADVTWRERARVRGRIRSVRVRPWVDVAALECVVVDPTGGLPVVFSGRRKVPGLVPGAEIEVEGTATEHRGRLALLNPIYTLLPARP